ncbi:hypothetical protein P175DRAFT_0527668 [Aspergillus ochraceoroseus IBT 24754]|uniref:Uncharacterized protein n=1 Tax=Aspergillus ochraceoroseus IBT 24754 TaxID=1392256 RepID=A0A2T5M6R4_9EURO|nr:uncharacterized protein P175DRAFT_0527668 [Aspergillus ochraceoroseus IBT 24754]PTU24219.1 hypothetical protein P175DRAFT_0527668 [Aspergillus ochraceoroseus IBT 24754]
MAGYLYSRAWELPRRQIPAARRGWSPLCRHITGISQTSPSQSQLLRFALLPDAPLDQREGVSAAADRYLRQIFLQKWPSDSPPPPVWVSSSRLPKRGAASIRTMIRDIQNARTIRELQICVEKYLIAGTERVIPQRELCDAIKQALALCEQNSSYGEILSTFNGIVTRLEQLYTKIPSGLCTLGMCYASFAFSKFALERYLRSYLAVSPRPLSLDSSLSIVNALLSSLRASSFQPLEHSAENLLELTAGGGCNSSNLHSVLYWTQPQAPTDAIGEYLSLLLKLGDDSILHELWNRHLENTSPSSSFQHFQSAYVYALALVETGCSQKALAALTQISERADDALPGISKFEDLSNLLTDKAISQSLYQIAGEGEYVMILDTQLDQVERRLGIRWQPDIAQHTSVLDSLDIPTESSLLAVDGNNSGYISSEQLMAEIRALKCSKSITDLGWLASLLEDHEGHLVPVAIPSCKVSDSEFYWALQRSPVELSEGQSMTDGNSETWSPSNLGMIKVVSDIKTIPWTLERSLNLIQLGYLLRRKTPSHQDGSGISPQLEESGHIVAWNRPSNQLLIVFIGTGQETITPHVPIPSVPKSSDLDAIAEIIPLEAGRVVSQGDFGAPLGINTFKYHIETDPCSDVIH